MSAEPNKTSQPSLSEISHLFLSSVRERQTGGVPRPQRKPPQPAGSAQVEAKPPPTIDLIPEEFEEVFREPEPAESAGSVEPTIAAASARPAARVTAVLSSHLNAKGLERAKEYAHHLAVRTAGRVGMIELDVAAELRVTTFDPTGGTPDGSPTAPPLESNEPRRVAEALDELDCDVDQWLLYLPSPRTPEARQLLHEVEHWVLLCTCDHEGLVSCYRSLKGLSESHRADGSHPRLPRLSLAILDARDNVQAARVFRKLAGVCQQFLAWPLEAESAVAAAITVREDFVLSARASNGNWQAVRDFLVRAANSAKPRQSKDHPNVNNFVSPVASDVSAVQSMSAENPPQPTGLNTPNHDGSVSEVIDLSGAAIGDAGVLDAVMQHVRGELVETPIRAPMCPQARLAVSRDRRLVLMAVERHGLGDLRSIGLAYRWMIENRSLICMAIPQFAIDAHAMPQLRLLVDQADVSAEVLQPMLQSHNVRVQTYRKLRWGEKTGLLLEAA